MAKYKLLEKAFIDNRLYEAGEIVEVSGNCIPGPHMSPHDAEARKKAREVGLVNGPLPDPVDQLTAMKVEAIGASPQDVRSGMASELTD